MELFLDFIKLAAQDQSRGNKSPMPQFGNNTGMPTGKTNLKENILWHYIFEGQPFPYERYKSDEIEAAFKNNKATLKIDEFSYINFKRKVHVNNSGEEYPIKRVNIDDSKEEIKVQKKRVEKSRSQPKAVKSDEKYNKGQLEKEDKLPVLSRTPPENGTAKRIPIKEDTSEYKDIKSLFDRTMSNKYKYFEICKVINPRLQYFFNDNLIRITKENKKSVANTTKRLFFSMWNIKQGITLEDMYNGYTANFDPKFIDNGPWGRGVCFIPTVLPHSPANGINEVILANVIVGNSYPMSGTNSSLIYPPKLEDHPVKRYDSVLGKQNGLDVHVIYDKYLAYPEYIISYANY